ncbi:MAG: polyprenol monophosphomannose synthase [Planctomycetota bacterium]
MPTVSLIIPTLNEAANLPELVGRITAALPNAEILVVDDGSTDDTARVAADLPVRLIVRDDPSDGLSGAVLRGISEASGDVVCVMDADLQHPPEVLPAIVGPIVADEADFVIGSRYVSGGTVGEKWGMARRLNSKLATVLALPFSGGVHDPMSGFFALRKSAVDEARFLSPLGYKVGLELLCKTNPRRIREVPIHFDIRKHGTSKLTIAEQFRYLEHLSRLYDFTYPRLAPILKFAVVVALAWLFGAAAFALTHTVALAYPVAIAVAALFHFRYVRAQRPFLKRKRPWVDFLLSAAAEWAWAVAASLYIGTRHAAPPWETFGISFTVATVVRYVLRKELMLDVRGLRFEPRAAEVGRD